jgi:4-aminobutyrate aminotransferase-like enzyme
LIVDEIYTGFGRTGAWLACSDEGVVPDLLCVGKGLASGMPISACLGKRAIFDAWPKSDGEALHTQTFLGHPASCAAALASLSILEAEGLVEHAAVQGSMALERLQTQVAPLPGVEQVRGRGLMIGIECKAPNLAHRVCARALESGLILLPSGEGGRVLSLTPPLCIDADAMAFSIDVLARLIEEASASGAG